MNLTTFIAEQEKKVEAMRQWYELNPHISYEEWDGSPYPAMLKLLACVKVLSESAEFYGSLGDFKPTHPCDVDVRFQIESGGLAREALSKCESIIAGER